MNAEDLLDRIAADGPPQDKLDQIREVAQQARDTKLLAEDLEQRAAEERRRLSVLTNEVLPNLFQEAGMSGLDLEPSGNLPGFSVKLKSYAAASIAAKWTEDRRRAAFAELTRKGAEDLIKVTVTFSFPKGMRHLAMDLAEEKSHLRPEVKEEVHHGTLTAWLYGLWEDGKPLPDLDAIGGRIGYKAVITEN